MRAAVVPKIGSK